MKEAKFQIKSVNIIKVSAILILAISLIRLLVFFYDLPNEPVLFVLYPIMIISLALLIIINVSIIRLMPTT